MAKYKDVYEGISKIIECGICMSHLHKPKVLHCQHSFCKGCIDNILKFNPDGSAVVICPFRCAGSTDIPADQTSGQLGVNYQLLGIVDMYKESCAPESTSECYVCHSCKEPVPVIYCSQCHNFYCGKCESPHSSHSVIKITYSDAYDQYMPLCKEHDSLGNYICCKEIVCAYCVNRKHKGHTNETLSSHAERIKKLFFNQDGSGGKIENIMQKAKDNYDTTVASLAETKKSFIETLKSRMLMSISEHINSVEKEAVRLMELLDMEICKQISLYPDVTPSDFLKTVAEKDNLELVVRRELILKEYSKYTTRVPSLHVKLTDVDISPDKYPLGNLEITHGEYLPISGDDNKSSVNSTLPQNEGIFDVLEVVTKLENLMKEAALKEGKFSTSMPQYSDTKLLLKGQPSTFDPSLQESFSLLDMRGYDYIDELFIDKKEQLVIDLVSARRDIASLRDNTGVTILHSAAQHGFEKLLAYLLEARIVDINVTQKFKQTALHYAAYHNKVPCVRLLLDHMADTNLRNHKGSRPIDVATQYKCTDVLALLQQADA